MNEGLPYEIESKSQSEATAGLLLDLIEEAVIVVGRDLVILEWNAGATRMFGWMQDEATGMSIEHLHNGNVTTGLANCARSVFELGRRWSGEVPFSSKGGSHGLCEAVALPLASGHALFSIRDITQRHRRLEELSEERKLLRTIVDGIPDLIFLKDREGRHILRNRAEREITGLPDDAVLGKKVTELGMPPDIAAAYFADDQRVLATGEPVLNREEPYVLGNRGQGWFLTNKHPIFDANNHVIGLVGIARDITEQRRATDELNEARMMLSRHLDNSLLAVAEMDPDSRITRWNDRATAIFGWTADEALGKTPHELGAIHPDEAANVGQVFTRLISGVESHNTSENRNLTKDKRVVHCRWFNSILRDGAGKIRSFLTMAEDVTSMVEAVEKLKSSDRLLRTLIDAMNAGYIMLNEQGCILDVNDKYLSFLGASSPTELLGLPARKFVSERHLSQFYAEFARLLREGSARNVEIDLQGAGGVVSPFEFNAKTEHTANGIRIHVFCRDITVRRRAIEERQAIERKMQETQKLESLGVLAGGIAHDFNNLLTGILGNASLASGEIPPDSKLHKYLEQIETASLRAADLCKQMLAYSGKGRFVIQKHDLGELLRDTVDLLRISISKRIELLFDLSTDEAPVMADATQLRQVIMNLVINASEAIAESGGSICISSGHTMLDMKFLASAMSSPEIRAGRFGWFEVADNGCGMNPDVLGKIFDPFFTTKFTGRGLGLAAVLGIVRGHQGALTVESSSGKGTRFRVYLPLTEGRAESLGPQQLSLAWRSEGRVLVVDDEETVRTITSRILESIGLTPVLASDGLEAVKKFQSDPTIRLVLVDLTMPHMDGEETFREIRRMRPGTKVLLMSGFNEHEAMSRFVGLGLAGFVQKPFNVSQLTTHVREALG
jgi:two-component system, cell cycle sensor histidine kinase and response regulator CckA